MTTTQRATYEDSAGTGPEPGPASFWIDQLLSEGATGLRIMVQAVDGSSAGTWLNTTLQNLINNWHTTYGPARPQVWDVFIGENDLASDASVATAAAQIEEGVRMMTAYAPNSLIVLNEIVTELAARPKWAEMRAAQAGIASRWPNVRLVLHDTITLHTDGLHYALLGQQECVTLARALVRV